MWCVKRRVNRNISRAVMWYWNGQCDVISYHFCVAFSLNLTRNTAVFCVERCCFGRDIRSDNLVFHHIFCLFYLVFHLASHECGHFIHISRLSGVIIRSNDAKLINSKNLHNFGKKATSSGAKHPKTVNSHFISFRTFNAWENFS